MNQAAILRLVHVFVASLVALASYGAVLYVTADQTDTWNVFGTEGCRTAVDAIFCVFSGVISIFFNLVLIGIPLAILTSSIYLKLVQTSLVRSAVSAVTANVLWILSIVAIVQYARLYSLTLCALLLPIAYLVVGLPAMLRPRMVSR